jgi:hypothetical protein
VLGALPPFPVAGPYRQEAAGVVAGARDRYGAEVTVLRLLSTVDGSTVDDQVSYLAELYGPAPGGLVPTAEQIDEQPLRAPYARPGGPAASLAWAGGVLDQVCGQVSGPVRATQQRTWNLSSIWRLEHPGGVAWLKEVPDFFRHEGPLLEWLAAVHPGFAPTPLAVSGTRMLLADIPGEDRYGASGQQRLGMLAAVHRVQRDAVGRLPELAALGVPALDAGTLADRIRDVLRRYGRPDAHPDLANRLQWTVECGLPDALVHGDLYPGNVRGEVVLDWGDSMLGHPGFDLLRMVEDLPVAQRAPLASAWCGWWRNAAPGCDPERALRLLAPIAPLRAAVVYAAFLDGIEPTERVYHEADVPACLARAAELQLC